MDRYWCMGFHNKSNIDPIYCVLDRCISDNMVTPGSKFGLGNKVEPGIFKFSKRPDKLIKDSIAIYFLNPQEIELDSMFLAESEAAAINHNPSLILAMYVFSVEQLNALNWSFSFPPDDRMKELGVITKPSYEELNNKYGR